MTKDRNQLRALPWMPKKIEFYHILTGIAKNCRLSDRAPPAAHYVATKVPNFKGSNCLYIPESTISD